jgi:RNA polymerase sigma-70 factor (ECF subfamily)
LPPDPRPDDALIAAANHGDEHAMEALYHRYKDWVVRLARRFTAHDDDSLDVLQETFAYVFRKFPGFRLTAAMTTFLYPVVRNLSLAARRKRTAAGRIISDDELLTLAPAPVQPDDRRHELATVMQILSPAHSEVVLMRFVDDMTLQEIAAALSIPVGTAKSRLHNALACLRDDPRARRYFDQP